MKFGTNSFLVLQFTERYRREQQRKDQQGTPARKRRASSPSAEKFSIRFRTRRDGLLLLAMDSAMISDSGYTALEVTVTAIWCLSLQLSAVLFLSVASFFRGCFGGIKSRNKFLANQKPMQCDQYLDRFLVSREAVVLVGRRVKHENLVLSNGLLKKIFNMLIGHFRVLFSLYVKANLRAKNSSFHFVLRK